MTPEVCAVIMAAGVGQRLRPLTATTPKALCPVGNVPLLDRALARVGALGFDSPERLAVNACYLGEQVVAHVGDRAWLSVEPGSPLGTAGGLGNLKAWLDGRGALVGNADAYLAGDLPPGPDIAALLDGWSGDTVRLLTVSGPPGEFSGQRFAGFSLVPWDLLAELPAEPADLVRVVWRPAERDERLELVTFPGTYTDTGTPRDYLAANLDAAHGGDLVAPGASVTGRLERAVVGAGATVAGEVIRGVVWPGATVAPGERLVDAIRVGADLTVPASQ